MKKLFYISLFIILGNAVLAQSINTRFGKNRVQYHDDFKIWDKYETENFIVHWYGKARNVARTVIPIAELYHNEIQDVLEHRMNDKIQIIVYLDVADLNQSNIGNDDTWTSKSGETKIVGNKMFVYFDGNHQNLRTQLKEGIASVYLSSMMFGSNFQEIVQNAVLLHLPDWYKKGIIAYAGSNWNLEIEDELRDIWMSGDKYRKFKKLANDFPRVAGHAMWYFISQYYSQSAIPNLLYLTKISRDLEESFIYVLSEDEDTVYEAWNQFFTDYFKGESGRYAIGDFGNKVDLKNKKYVPISKLRFSPSGNTLAYAYNEIGQYRIVLRDLETGKEETIFKYGYKNALQETDYNYPLFTWHDDTNLSLIYEDKDVIKLRKINLSNGEIMDQIIPEEFQRIYEFEAIDDINYIFNAAKNGFSDLYTYDAKFRTSTPIIDDFYDDLDARIITYNGQRGIIFSSNRSSTVIEKVKLDTILPLENFDLFFYPMDAEGDRLIRITETPDVNERYPFNSGNENEIGFVSDRNGMRNLFTIDPLSGRSYPLTNLDRNIIIHDYNKERNQYLFMAYRNGAYDLFQRDNIAWNKPITISGTPLNRKKNQFQEALVPLIVEEEKEEVIEEGFKFQSKFNDPKNIKDLRDDSKQINLLKDIYVSAGGRTDSKAGILEFNQSRVTASRRTFRLDNFITKFDNQVLFEGLESYAGEPNQLEYVPNGLLLKGTIKDLLEDYSIEGGVRIPTTFDGTEYFLVVDDKKDLIDKRYALYRRVFTDRVEENFFPTVRSKKNTLIGLYQLKYPFDVYRSLRLTNTLRIDRFYFQSTEDQSFGAPITNEQRLGVKLEYIYDNTIDIDENIKHGTRYKAYVEGINRFNLQLIDGASFNFSEAYTAVIGFDFRHYIPVLEHSIFALRAAGAASFGSEKIMYYLGGTDGWIFQQFNDLTPTPEGNFAFKTAATQMRGFKFNIRNGSKFGLINSELRVPILKYLLGKNIKSSFFRNLQIVGFFDAGVAFHGSGPFDDANLINRQTITSEADGTPIVQVEVNYFRDPLVMGYGAGLRTKILGYFLKFDYAWGVETRTIQDPIFYFAIGTDF